MILVMKNIAAKTATMRAEQGTFIATERKSPVSEPISEIATEASIMLLYLWKKFSAIICGRESIDISSIMPTSLIVKTIHSAIRTVIVSEMAVTGSPEMRAKSRSKATATIVLK